MVLSHPPHFAHGSIEGVKLAQAVAETEAGACRFEEWAVAGWFGEADRDGIDPGGIQLAGWSVAGWRLSVGVGATIDRWVWVGSEALPFVSPLHTSSALSLSRGVAVRSMRKDQRCWAIEQCLRCSAISAVIADGRGFGFTMTRRLQLAVESRGRAGSGNDAGPYLILLRTRAELDQSSAARVRGVVSPRWSEDGVIRWTAALLRRKGMQPADDLAEGGRVVLEIRDGKVVAEREPAGLADRPGASCPPPTQRVG